jgi:hypothetical protein
MIDETCKWHRIKDLVWSTECKHQIGTPRSWDPVEGMACICCKKPVEVLNDTGSCGKERNSEDLG